MCYEHTVNVELFEFKIRVCLAKTKASFFLIIATNCHNVLPFQRTLRVTWHDVRRRRGRWPHGKRVKQPAGGGRKYRKFAASRASESACVPYLAWYRAVWRRNSSGQAPGGHLQYIGTKCCMLPASMTHSSISCSCKYYAHVVDVVNFTWHEHQ